MDYYKITYYSGRTQYEPDGGDLKSNAYRCNYVTGAVVEMIDFTLQYVKNILTRTHHVVEPDSYIYINPKNGCLRYPGNVNRTFNALEKSMCGDASPHATTLFCYPGTSKWSAKYDGYALDRTQTHGDDVSLHQAG